MNSFQRLGGICVKKLWWGFLCILVYNEVKGQGQGLVIPLEPTAVRLKAVRHYYLLDVIDRRSSAGARVGHIIRDTRAYPIQLPQKAESQLYEFWGQSVPGSSPGKLPLTIAVSELNISEKRAAPGRITGEAAIAVAFSWQRDGREIPLTSFKAKSTFTRPEASYDHTALLTKMLTDAIQYFDQWMVVNQGKNPALVQGVRLVFMDEPGRDHSDTVFYRKDRPLTYHDFKASPRPGRYAAMVFTSISYEGNSKVEGNEVVVYIGLKTFMVKSMSWIRPESKNSNVLRHEQLHFDIAKVIAERFRKKLSGMTLSVDDHDSEIQYQFLEFFREMNRLQEQYDSETRHGLDAAKQALWDKKVTSELSGI